MKLTLNSSELTAMKAAVGSLVRAGTQQEVNFKPHSTDAKVLVLNRSILEKVQYAEDMPTETKALELNRQEAKVLIATMVHTVTLQDRIMQEYNKRDSNHPSFSSTEPGRAKSDYIGRLTQNMTAVNGILEKIRSAL